MTRKVAVMWDCYGLESAVRIDDFDQQRVLAILKGEDPTKVPLPLNLSLWQLRAQVNSQRHYEIYTFDSGDFSLTDVRNLFETTPQVIVDFVREHGTKIYSDRVSDSVIV